MDAYRDQLELGGRTGPSSSLSRDYARFRSILQGAPHHSRDRLHNIALAELERLHLPLDVQNLAVLMIAASRTSEESLGVEIRRCHEHVTDLQYWVAERMSELQEKCQDVAVLIERVNELEEMLVDE